MNNVLLFHEFSMMVLEVKLQLSRIFMLISKTLFDSQSETLGDRKFDSVGSVTIHWKAVEQYFILVLLFFNFITSL